MSCFAAAVCAPLGRGHRDVGAGPGGGPGVVISMIHYLCPLGEGKWARVSVVNGKADRVWY